MQDKKFLFYLKKMVLMSGLDQKEISKKMEVSQPTISRWLSGKREISLKNLGKLLKLLEMANDGSNLKVLVLDNI